MSTGTIKISALNTIPSLSSFALFTGVLNNEDGTFTNYNFTPQQLLTFIGTNNKVKFTVGTTGNTITNGFFSNIISKIYTNYQVYLAGDDFTQSGTTITGVTISFSSGQTIMAEI